MKQSKQFTVQTFEEDGETIMPLPIELCEELNIGEGTELKFRTNENGEIIMERKNEMKIFAVETISTFRHVYFVRAESAEHASDAVVCADTYSFFQKHICEEVFRSKEVSNAEIAELIRETEQPEMTLEKLESGKWLQNCVYTVDYSK